MPDRLTPDEVLRFMAECRLPDYTAERYVEGRDDPVTFNEIARQLLAAREALRLMEGSWEGAVGCGCCADDDDWGKLKDGCRKARACLPEHEEKPADGG